MSESLNRSKERNQLILDAITSLVRNGEKATQRRIQSMVGGSFSDIGPVLRKWKEEHPQVRKTEIPMGLSDEQIAVLSRAAWDIMAPMIQDIAKYEIDRALTELSDREEVVQELSDISHDRLDEAEKREAEATVMMDEARKIVDEANRSMAELRKEKDEEIKELHKQLLMKDSLIQKIIENR